MDNIVINFCVKSYKVQITIISAYEREEASHLQEKERGVWHHGVLKSVSLGLTVLTYKTVWRNPSLLAGINRILYLKCRASSQVDSTCSKSSFFSQLTGPKLLFWKMAEPAVLTASPGIISQVRSCPAYALSSQSHCGKSFRSPYGDLETHLS